MVKRIEIINDLETFQGTCYVEIIPGKYSGKDWVKGSLFFTDETFTFFSKAIEKHYKNYSLWGISEINRDTWKLIVAELENLKLFLTNNPKAEDLNNQIEFLYLETTKKFFLGNLNQNLKDLVQVLDDLQLWITEKSKNNEYISILGV
ncbi:hypothetical protein JOC77_000711 [Peribacillus deserti]|uniref:Uncharacterized protein n=1 Tax=Peribacillus deserti TaxID=673318 RepID=A0ABS2QDR0_9BACI|nr:hypothetical protein [Peribacillus deserti]MBM7691306.1 hypothetical protein [Peribacillus deserti]